MAASLMLKRSLPRLKLLFHLQRFSHTLVEEQLEAEFLAELGPKTTPTLLDHVDTSKWKQVNARKLGISLSMIPEAPREVLNVLQSKGYDAYLVGGCVRDLLLSKTPRDFDVVTTATLQEIKENFRRAFIMGRQFPICRVCMKDCTIEVSSFEGVATDSKEKEDVQLSKIPDGYDEKDIMRWRDSLKRDFTINSLFYDPFAHRIYDYSGGMTDLTSLKLRTLIPAKLSFKEDCARILMALRLAARLGLSFAEDTEAEIHNHYGSVAALGKTKLRKEMICMLSSGAAHTSLLLLKRFNLLEVLFPFQAAYLSQQSGAQNPLMLMELFFNLDNAVLCGQRCDPGLWVSLLAFHLALVNHPQDALVIWTISAVLYHGSWKEGVKTARELAGRHVNFVPEILESSSDVTNKELAGKVANFASVVVDSIDALTDSEHLSKVMGGFPSSRSSLLVFISRNTGSKVAAIFSVLMDGVESLEEERHRYSIDYKLLEKGDIEETRFVLGKVIMDTMKGSRVSYHQPELTVEKKQDLEAHKLVADLVKIDMTTSVDCKLQTSKLNHRVKQGAGECDEKGPINQKQAKETHTVVEQKLVKEKIREILNIQKIPQKVEQKTQVMKDVEGPLSLQKILTQRDAQLELRKNGEPDAPGELLSVLRMAPKMMNGFEAELAPITTESKVIPKPGSGKLDNEQDQKMPKKQKQKQKQKQHKTLSGSVTTPVKENIGEILSTQDIAQKSKSTQKKAVKDTESFLSLQKKLTQKCGKLEGGRPGEADYPRDILILLQKASKMTEEHKMEPTPRGFGIETPDSRGLISYGLEDELCRKQIMKQTQNKQAHGQKPVKERIRKTLGTQKNEPQEDSDSVKDVEQLVFVETKITKKPQIMRGNKSEGPEDLENVQGPSNLFGGKASIEKDAEPGKEQKVGEQSPQSESEPKLYRLFKYASSVVTNLFR